jgi:RES domain-containing protein
LSGRGGLLFSGRWNQLGTPVVYCSDHPATALLETLAHVDRDDVPASFRLLTIEAPDDLPVKELSSSELGPDWRTEIRSTKALGTALLDRAEHLLTFVPCVLVPFARNALLNPRHGAARRCSIVEVIEEAFDPRLIR